MKIRPCKRGCRYPALPRLQLCYWHNLMRKSNDVQSEAAGIRLGKSGQHQARVGKDDWPEGERWCAGCQSFVPLFYCSGSQCRACKSKTAHASRVEKTYGITAEEYARILKNQGGRCAICLNMTRTIRLAVDHDHKTGRVRGLLCKRCNHDLLGGGHDDVEMLLRAVGYLLFPTAVHDKRPTMEAILMASAARVEAIRAVRAQSPEMQPPPF